MKYGVITRLPDDPRGNLAMAMGNIFWDTQGDGDDSTHAKLIPLHEKIGVSAMYVQAPVFRLGEVLFLNEDGRELYGDRRKPSKWGVTCEVYDQAEVALARAERVLAHAQG